MRNQQLILKVFLSFIVLALPLMACSNEQNVEQQPYKYSTESSPEHYIPRSNQGDQTKMQTTDSSNSVKPDVLESPTVENKQQDTKQKEQTKENLESKIKEKVTREVKGMYVSAYALQGEKWSKIERLLKSTELNALVIDVKNDSGRVTYTSGVKTAQQIGADKSAKFKDITPLLTTLQNEDTYTIARIVTFKDPYLAAKKPEWAMKTKFGKVWRDKKGISWVDPYNEDVWEYSIQLAKEAIRKGFDEVQFDYVRFPEQVKKMDREVVFRNPKNETKDQIIARFLRTAREEIRAVGGVVSADVFGLTTTARDGMGIGQKWESIAPEVDAISPMIYPSHYAKGSYGVRYPDLQPYKIVSEAVKDANKRNAKLKVSHDQVARIRPWIQDFTAKWVKPHQTYRKPDVLEQIKALQEQGIQQYILWNSSCNYSL
jgi:hypothetical protein